MTAMTGRVEKAVKRSTPDSSMPRTNPIVRAAMKYNVIAMTQAFHMYLSVVFAVDSRGGWFSTAFGVYAAVVGVLVEG